MNKARLLVLKALVISLLITLGGRLYYLQILSGDKYTSAAEDNRVREIVTQSSRGSILDELGRPLVTNRTAIVVTVSHFELVRQKDKGKAVLARLAKLLGENLTTLSRKVTPCGPDVPLPCWNGTPQQPVPVKQYEADEPDGARKVLVIKEHPELYPSVEAGLKAVRDYPNKTLAAHELGYLSPITDEELKKGTYPDARATDLIGRTGLEASYNSYLSGKDGVRQLIVDRSSNPTGVLAELQPKAGDNIVLSMDSKVQKVAEDALAKWTAEARTRSDRDGKKYAAPAAAAVVMDAKSGRVIALAGYPTYDPTAFVGGISTKEYAALNSESAGRPLVSQAVQGLYAPGSTFKIVTTAAVVKSGEASFGGVYDCPPYYELGGSKFSNFEGEALGHIGLTTALIKSCDTIFYKFAADMWAADGKINPGPHPNEFIATMGRAFGFGKKTGIDLPSESTGRIADRAYKTALYKQMKVNYCNRARTGYPEYPDPAFADYLKRLAIENCADGADFKGGEAVIQAVGQGETVVTPLQLAVAYAALANGGTLFQPLLAKAAISQAGKVTKTFTPKVVGKLPVDEGILASIRSALVGVTGPDGTAGGAFAGFPMDKVQVAGKTGTAEVANKQDTSWFASFAPASDPKFVVVGMIAEGGQGGQGAGRMVRDIYDGIYGFGGKPAALPEGKTPTKLPTITTDGTIKPPADAPKAPVVPKTTNKANPSGSPSPTPSAFAVGGLGIFALVGRGRARLNRRRRRSGRSMEPGASMGSTIGEVGRR